MTSDNEVLNAVCRESLEAFTCKAFEVLEPSTAFEYNWHVGCLPYDEAIITEQGIMQIGLVVESGYAGKVLSYNHDLCILEWKKVTHRMKNNGRQLYDLVSCKGDKITLTDNHPVWANGKYVEASKVKNGDSILRVLQETVFEGQVGENEILLNGLFRPGKDKTKEHNLPEVSGSEVLRVEDLQQLQGKKNRETLPLCKLWKSYLQNAIRHGRLQKNEGCFLQQRMLRFLCDGQEQHGLHRRKVSSGLSKDIPINKDEDNRKGWWSLLSLFVRPKKDGRSSCGQEQGEQRGLESGISLQTMPQPAKARSAGDIRVSECYVRSITKSLRVSEAVYNIEVEDNNNYFAGGVLVHNCIAEHLEAVWRGDIRLLCINMPPRSLKTITTSVCFPAWGLGKKPTTPFMLTSFKSSLAEKMTRKTRMVMQSEWYKQLFDTRISEELNRQYYFETTERGQYFSSSMSSVTGEGADIQILDDPLNPDEALSDQIRESTNETVRGTLFSRFNDPRTGRFILNMQRLHDDDTTGNLLKDMGWTHLKLPAEAIKKKHSIYLGDKSWTMEENELLFPKRFTREVLDQARIRLGEYNYAGQYLQEPVPLGGGMLKPSWVQFYNPGSIKPKKMNVVILVDPAGGDEDEKEKKNKHSDWTVMVVVGLADDNNYYVLDMIRDRLNPTERIDTLFILHRKWNALCGKPPKVGYEKYSMQSDIHYVKTKKDTDTYHFPLITVAGPKSKTSRVSRLIPDMEYNRWYVPNSLIYIDIEGRKWDLVKELLDTEMPTFPRSKHDDMLDALSRVYEEDLNMVFPRPSLGIVEKSMRPKQEDQSWESY